MGEVIRAALREKSTGTDEIFVKALKLAPHSIAKSIIGAWNRCSELQYVIEDWMMAKPSPLYKNGGVSNPKNHWPIAFLLLAKNVLDAAVVATITKPCKVNEYRLGF